MTQDWGGLDLLPYWLLGVAGDDINWDEVNTPQKRAADAHRAPKLITHEDFTAPLNYAYHIDAVKLARFLRATAIDMGVTHVVDTVERVSLTEDGSVGSLQTRANGSLTADLYVDCTGFRAQLIGAALGIPYRSCRSTLFCDTALAVQVPDEWDAPSACAGWAVRDVIALATAVSGDPLPALTDPAADAARKGLVHDDGSAVKIRPKVMDLLAYKWEIKDPPDRMMEAIRKTEAVPGLTWRTVRMNKLREEVDILLDITAA